MKVKILKNKETDQLILVDEENRNIAFEFVKKNTQVYNYLVENHSDEIGIYVPIKQ